MKNIKLLIIILTIFSVILICTIIALGVQNSKMQNDTNIANNIGNIESSNITENTMSANPELTYNTSLQEVTSNSILYSLSNNINKYFEYIKEENTQAVNELGGNTVYTISNNVKYVVKQAYSTENEYMTKYYTYGILTIANGNLTATEQEVFNIIYVDIENNTYLIEQATKEELSNMKELGKDENIDIPQGTYNNFEYEYVDNVKQMEIYLEDFVFQIFNNIENAYNILNEEYRTKRFGSVNKFVEYVTEKQNQIRNIKIVQYSVEDEAESKVYKGTDEYGNYYHIIENAYMEYEIILDNYTMEDYSSSNEEEKIEKSAEKFILMLNSADYTNAYNLLEQTFKETYFPTEQEFINYIKNNWYERNIIASKEVNSEGICIVTIKDAISTESNQMQKQFKITMGEDMNFEIEFDL